MMDDLRPKVGVGVLVLKDGKILLGKRKNTHGDGLYASPGGHLEHMESFELCAIREVKEETNMEICNIRFVRLLNFKDYAPKHYVDVAVVADWKSGSPEIMEPDKCEGWEWYDLDDLPSPIFPTLPSILQAYKTGEVFFDA